MGCDCDTFLVKTDSIYNFNYNDWWNNKPVFPNVDNETADYYAPCFDNSEGLLWDVFDKCNFEKIRYNNNDGWCVIEINLSRIDKLIDKTKELLLKSIDIQDKEDFKNSIFKSCFAFWSEDIPDEFLLLLKQLRYSKKVLNKYQGYSIIANINY